MKITKIEKQKKNASRYSVYIDDEFAFGVSEDVLLQFRLNKGMELDQAKVDLILSEEANEKLFLAGLNYLSYGLRTTKEMKDYLKKQIRKTYSKKDLTKDQLEVLETTMIPPVLKRLTDLGYLNDDTYGESYVRTEALLSKKGEGAIRRSLRKKGLDNSQIEEALDEYPFEQQVENATELGRKYIKGKKLSKRQLKQRLYQHLQQKGFSGEVLNYALDNLSQELEVDEFEIIEKEANRLYTRHSRRLAGSELKNKVKQALYQKGFQTDVINSWIYENMDYFE